MSQTVGDFLIERLHEWGISRIFGFPGDGINGLMGALNRAGLLISERTVAKHVQSIFENFRVSNKIELINNLEAV